MPTNLLVLCIAMAAVAVNHMVDEQDPIVYSEYAQNAAKKNMSQQQELSGQIMTEKGRNGVVLGALFVAK